MKRDPVLLAKLRSMGVGTRGIVWRIGQSLTWAALIRGRSGDVAESTEWHGKAVLLGEAIGVEPPPLPPPEEDRVTGSAAALGYVLRTVPTAMSDAIEPYGDDHLGLFECALKLGLIDFLGVGKGETLDAIAGAVRGAGLRGKLPEAFQQSVGQIVAAVGSDRAVELILACYQMVSALLKEESASKDASPSAPSPKVAVVASAPPVAALLDRVATAPPPPSPAGDVELARRRFDIYRLSSLLATAVTLHPYPEDAEKARSRLLLARDVAAALGVAVPELPASVGNRVEDLRRCLGFLQTEMGVQMATALCERYGPAQGALFAALAKLSLFAQRYQPKQAESALELVEPLVEDLLAAKLPAELWGSLLAVDVAVPENDPFDEWYTALRRAIRRHLEGAVG